MSEGSSPRPPVPLATWNSARGVWETPQASLLCAHSVPYSAPWPTSGSMRAGVCFAPPTSEPRTAERIFLAAWPSGRITAVQDPDQQLGSQRGQPAPGETQAGRPWPEPGGRGRVAPAHPEGLRRHQGLAQPAPRQWGLDPALGGSAPAALPGCHAHTHDRAAEGRREQDPTRAVAAAVRGSVGRGGRAEIWGPYATAITRWERATRPAPRPTDDAGRLSPRFVEWMQGLPPGWVTGTPGLGRPAQLTALGNGVVPQQAARALRILTPPRTVCRHRAPR